MAFEPTLDAIPVVSGLNGPPRKRPDKLHADKGYDFARCRHYLKQRGITARIARRGVESCERLGRHRWVVERCRFRQIAHSVRTAFRHSYGVTFPGGCRYLFTLR
jgi:IS5 family transposase